MLILSQNELKLVNLDKVEVIGYDAETKKVLALHNHKKGVTIAEDLDELEAKRLLNALADAYDDGEKFFDVSTWE